jgi:hypothetical protein
VPADERNMRAPGRRHLAASARDMMDHNTLNRKTLVGWLLLEAGAISTIACAQQIGSDRALETPGGDAAQKGDLAIARAREALRVSGVDPSTLTLKSAEPVIWPDSSLGCRRPGIQYLQVQTPGYRIELRDAHADYAVHVAGDTAIVCSGAAVAGSPLAGALVPLRGIDVVTQRAKQMLAALVHAPAEQIRVVGLEPQVWSDTGLGCPSPTAPVPGRVSGFRIVLEHGGRAYTFNTDLHRVLACPPIDTD